MAGFDLEAAEWRYRVTKTGVDHIVRLSKQATEILNELHPLTGNGKFVFPSARHPRGDRSMIENAVLYAMRGLGIGKDQMTGHGFRALARTILDEVLGFRVDLIEHQLAHQVPDPLGVLNGERRPNGRKPGNGFRKPVFNIDLEQCPCPVAVN